MSCNVEAIGENKETFNKLKEDFGQYNALYSIVQEEQNTHITPGFISSVEQTSRVNAVTLMALNHLKDDLTLVEQIANSEEVEEQEAILDTANKAVTKKKLNIIKDKIAENILGVIKSANDNATKAQEVIDNISNSPEDAEKAYGDKDNYTRIANRAYVLYKNLDGVFDKVVKNIKNLHIDTNSKEEAVTTEENNQDDVEKEAVQQVYGKSHLEKSPLESAKTIILFYLSTQNKTMYGKNGEVIDVVDDLGMRVPLLLNDVFADISKLLASKKTVEDMIDALLLKGVVNPTMARIAQDLSSDLMESKTPTIIKGVEKKGFKAAFFNTFRKVYTNSFTVVSTYKEDANKDKYLSSFVVDTNTRSLDKVLTAKWFQQSRQYQNQPLQHKKDAWGKQHSLILGRFDSRELQNRLNNVHDMEILTAVQHLLKTLGMHVSVVTLQEMRVLAQIKAKNTGVTFYDIVAGNPKYGISFNALAEKFWGGTDVYNTETTTVGIIAKAQASNETEVGLQAFLNSNRNLIYPLNLPTSTTDLFDDLTTGKAVYHYADPILSNLRLVKLAQKENVLKLGKFEAYKVPNASEGSEFTDLSPLGSMAMRLSGWANADVKDTISKDKGILLFPTPGDRGNSSAMLLPKIKNIAVIGNTIPSGEFKTWILDFAKAELARIKLALKDTVKIENYHFDPKNPEVYGNAMRFNYSPVLNQFLKIENGEAIIDLDNPAVQAELMKSVVASFNKDIEYLIENNILTKESTLEKPVYTKLIKMALPENAQTKEVLQSFLANSLAFNSEASLLFVGDAAFFKIGESQLANLNKRTGMAETPGVKPQVGESGAKTTVNLAIIDKDKSDSSILKEIDKVLGVKKSSYSGIDRTDGQGLCTLDRYLDLLLGQGPVSKEILVAIEELKKENPDMSKTKGVVFQPVKGFLHVNRFDPVFGRVMPMTLKYSVLPIFPAMFTVNGVVNNEMKMIYDKMIVGGQDEAVFTTTTKFGAYNVNKLNDAEFKTVVVHNEDYRIPQVVPYKEKSEENAGSQIEKIIMGDVLEDGLYYPTYAKAGDSDGVQGAVTGAKLDEIYQQALIENLRENYTTVMHKLTGADGRVDETKVAKEVVKSIESSAVNNTPEHITKALSIVNGRTLVPMSFPAIKSKVESTLFSMARKKITKKTIPGFVGVQYTSLGYDAQSVEKEGITVDQSLRWTRIDPETGKTLPAEIICSPVYFLQVLKKMNPTPAIEDAISKLEAGTFDITDLSDELNEIVVYRIPYQGLSSSVPVKIVGFTPEVAGSTIVVPMEMVTQAGIDFDIDKLYVEIKHFIVDENGKFTAIESTLKHRHGRNNIIIDTHYAVLTSPHHLKAMRTPNSSDRLEVLMNKYMEMYGSNNLEGSMIGNLKTQESFRNEGKDGGKFIGIAADASVFHSLLKKWGAHQLNRAGGDIKVNKTSFGSIIPLGNRLNFQGVPISEEFSQALTAALDNANVPILGNLNINSVTGPVFLWLLEAGAGLDYAVSLINTPVIRELVKEVRNRQQLMSEYAATEDSLVTILGKGDHKAGFKLKVGLQKRVMENNKNITQETINALGNNSEDTIRNIEALEAFLSFKRYADDLNSAKSALKIDVKGARESIAENMVVMQKLASITGTYASGKPQVLPVRQNKSFRLDVGKYRSHSISAYEKYGIIEAVRLVSDVVLDNSALFNMTVQNLTSEVFETMVDPSTGEVLESGDFEIPTTLKTLNGADLRILFNDLYTSLIASKSLFSESNLMQELLGSQTLINQVLYGESSTGQSVLDEQALEIAKGEADSNYQPNKFVMSLNVSINKNGEMINTVSFDNSIIQAMTTDQKNDLTSEFLRLNEDDRTAPLFNKLILYNLITEGFGRSIDSYGELLPAYIYDDLVGSDELSVIEYFRAIEDQVRNVKDTPEVRAYIKSFTGNFLRNRATKLSSIKDYTTESHDSYPDYGLYIIRDVLLKAKTYRLGKDKLREVGIVTENLNRSKTISKQFIQGIDQINNTGDASSVIRASEDARDADTNRDCIVPGA